MTQGCTHDECKFCSLYDAINFKVSPIDEVIEDMQEMITWYPQAKRVFLVGANPFVLNSNRLKGLANIAKTHFNKMESIGCFARISDISLKSDDELILLHKLGYDGITIGVESGNDNALSFMNKGFLSNETITQCKRLDKAGISYNFFYMTGLAGTGHVVKSGLETARMFNQLYPKTIEAGALTIFENTELYNEIQKGNFKIATEKEILIQMKTFIDNCNINCSFFANTISNTVKLEGKLPKDSKKLSAILGKSINNLMSWNYKNIGVVSIIYELWWFYIILLAVSAEEKQKIG
ncbi:radical SAM protein [Clostridioides difficile]|uniref:radical SAM protein n=1 Tax=Clostridioides difficile TaxID=1496 RepID=UPI00202EFE33|nr:radical SAM protein [Clostridioides difficile]MCB4304413.1 radical SAM protein [Clostridioides difficile]MCM0739265.1 radical SAM protein [Clostridioides difficile]MCM0743240.1 radical SAM protein [Clostridioides difficile]MCM0747057.1 radical SAM protein [Clostridioides difficile]MCP8365344.1 radical SAM protein [Clostridioides difficile]